jgi:hypothetical protein
MISTGKVQKYFFTLTRLAFPGGFSFKMNYKQKVLRVTIEPTGEILEHHNKGIPVGKKKSVDLKISDCKACGNLLVGGLCMTKTCTGQKPTTDPTLTM